MTKETQAKAADDVQTAPLSPGEQYVADFLPQMGRCDTEWLHLEIDAGRLQVCPRCHFVRLPKNPFDVNSMTANQNVTADDCEVCAAMHDALKFEFRTDGIRNRLEDAQDQLTRLRRERAQALYDLWISATLAADAMAWWIMRVGIDAAGWPLPKRDRQPRE